jgi:NADH-quinone oxidoreductase subunit L
MINDSYSYTVAIPLILFFSFIIIGLGFGRLNKMLSGIFGTLCLLVSTVLSYYTAYRYFFVDGKSNGVYQKFIAYDSLWLSFSDELQIHMGVLLDPISVMMLVVITTVSLMVHIYSLDYMKHEEGFSRYYSFLSLFSFSMLGLVISSNIFQIYVFWELVGLSSYLLIGHYYERPSAVAASKKAFIVTRFADFGFLIGILLLSSMTGTLDFLKLTDPNGSALTQGSAIGFMGLSVMTWSLLLVFCGAAGKSAMFPLHIWLPDAMEGPTPVSALIHAATMVVAGVYLVARLFTIYALAAPDALIIIGYIGTFTSLFAAIIACTQYDIKRVLAFSTISQIGLMMGGLGVSGYAGTEGLGYTASMFHLFTHAMFKALLFLCAGSVIHAVHTNEMTGMGGLRKHLPVTNIAFLIGCLAIAGVPPLSGFFSKDEILTAAFEKDKLLFAGQYLVAGVTAFYMFRLYYSIFWNRERDYHTKPHESPFTMLFALVFLSIASVIAGFIPFSNFVTPDSRPFESHIHWAIAVPAIIIAVAGILFATIMYRKESELPDKITSSLGGLYRLAYKKFYIDEIYIFVTKNIIFKHVSAPIAWFDRNVVDNTMNGIAALANFVSARIKGFQSGQLQQYAYVMVSGLIIIVLAVLYFMKA